MRYVSIDKIVLVVGIAIGFLSWRKDNPTYLKLLPFLFIIDLASETICTYLSMRGQNNMIYFNLYSIIFFPFYIYFFSENTDNRRLKKILHSAIVVLPVLMFLNMFFGQGLRVFNTYSFLTGTFLMIALGINYFYQLLSGPPQQNPLRNPAFWISLALTFYFIATFAVHSLPNFISSFKPETSRLLMYIVLTVNACFYMLLNISFLCRTTKRRSL